MEGSPQKDRRNKNYRGGRGNRGGGRGGTIDHEVETLKLQAAESFGCTVGSIHTFASEVDPFNTQNALHMAVCKQDGPYYGSVLITQINKRSLQPQLVYGTPKIEKKPQKLHENAQYFLANKWNGENVTVFKYVDEAGHICVSARPRGFPFLRDRRTMPYLTMLKKVLDIETVNNKEEKTKQFITLTKLPPILSLLAQDPVQSMTFELCGNELPELVVYDFPLALKPLFFTECNGKISPIIDPVPQPLQDSDELWKSVLYESRDIGPHDYDPQEIHELSKKFEEKALILNEGYRKEKNLKAGYMYKNFVIEGKVLYCLGSDGKLTDRESIYKIKPNDIEASHFVSFDSCMQQMALESLKKLYSKGEKYTEKFLQREMDLTDHAWSLFGRDIMDLTRGVPNHTFNSPLSTQKVVVMVGVPGSGKSTVANKLVTLNGSWSRINQDEMKSRQACERFAREALKLGQSVIVDRCNFDIKQRNTWIKIASEYGVNDIRCLHFNIPLEICKQRVTVREDHPTIPKGDTGPKIIEQFANLLLSPIKEEGFLEIWTVTNEQDLEHVLEKLTEIKKDKEDISSPNKKARNNKNPAKNSEDGFFNPFAALSDDV